MFDRALRGLILEPVGLAAGLGLLAALILSACTPQASSPPPSTPASTSSDQGADRGADQGQGAPSSPPSSQAAQGQLSQELAERRAAALAAMTPEQRAHHEACMAKAFERCVALAQIYQAQAQAAPTPEAAAPLWRGATLSYRRACSSGLSDACVKLGRLHEDKLLPDPQDVVAALMYKKACDAKHDDGCKALASLQAAGRAGKIQAAVDVVAAERAACAGGQPQACARLGERYMRGLQVQTDPAMAVLYFEQACKGADMKGCHAQGVMLMESRESDTLRQALDLFERACAKDIRESCYNAAFMIATGRGRPSPDEAASVPWLERACALKYQRACDQLAARATPAAPTPAAPTP